jgi:hypothetical protein
MGTLSIWLLIAQSSHMKIHGEHIHRWEPTIDDGI